MDVYRYFLTTQSCDGSLLALSLKAMESIPEIWDYYFSDFIAQTLHLEISDGITQDILRVFFIQRLKEKTMLERVADLHSFTNINHLDLAKLATVLRSLDQIKHVSGSVSNPLSPIVTSPTEQPVYVVRGKGHQLGLHEHIILTFVVSHLFHCLVGAVFGQKSPTLPILVSNPDKMLMWYMAYR